MLVLAAATVAQIPPVDLMKRLVIEIPFVLFVIVLPFVATGEKVHVVGIPLAVDGLWLAFGIVAKASLVLLGTAVLAACTPPASILAGAERLHAPRVMTAIAGFTIRYVEVVLAELQRMRTARIARGDDPRFLWQARAVIRSAGTLLVRCFERGERVQLAMISRGWDGGIPAGLLTAPAKTPRVGRRAVAPGARGDPHGRRRAGARGLKPSPPRRAGGRRGSGACCRPWASLARLTDRIAIATGMADPKGALPVPPVGFTDGTIALRPWRPSDGLDLAALCDDDEIRRFTSVPPAYPARDAAGNAAYAEAERLEGRGIHLAIIDTLDAVLYGAIDLTIPGANRSVGPDLVPARRRPPRPRPRHRAPCACSTAGRWAPSASAAWSACPQDDNAAAIAVAERAGFERDEAGGAVPDGRVRLRLRV